VSPPLSVSLALTVLAAGYGVAAGLLVPRVVYRLAVPAGEQRTAACPSGHPLDGPLRGWVGPSRCRRCPPGASFGPGAGRCVAAAAVVCAALAVAVGPRPELAVWLLAAPVGLALAAVDSAVNRLPDVLTLPLAAGTALLLGMAALLPHSGGSWPRALLGAVVLAGTYGLLFLINRRGMGLGDVKLALALGAALGWYGWGVLFAGTFLGFLLGSLYGVSLILAGRAHRRTAMAFGPFMVLGALVGVVAGGLTG
jgi:leader peptidase (prepilin peptidase) / N-methyltransferase